MPAHHLISILLTFLWLTQQVPFYSHCIAELSELFYPFHDQRANLLNYCKPGIEIRFDDECSILRIFNRTEVDEMDEDTNWTIATNCACYLSQMREYWDTFDDKAIRRIGNIVRNAEDYEDAELENYPDWLWSDLDIIIHQVSIFTSVRDFFYLQAKNKSMLIDTKLRKDLERDELWKLTRQICWRIAEDSHGLYRYTENLNRLNPVVFYGLVKLYEWINLVYTASKACKILLLHRFSEYKLKPGDSDYVPVFNNIGSPDALLNDIDSQLRENCILFQGCNKSIEMTIEDLLNKCPFVEAEKLSKDWLLQNPSALKRREIAEECGCQLLKQNSTWRLIMKDQKVQVMTRALTSYMNRNPVPDFSTSPIWTIFGWFEETMRRFKDRQFLIEQVVIVQGTSGEPSKQSKKEALEILRSGCNYIVFNYNRNQTEVPTFRIIKYLDNLRELSQDSTFVFQLTLQDVNLFKLYALSKMCKSVILH